MKNSFIYSPTTQGFYPKDKQAQLPYIEAQSLPDDLIDISNEDYSAWFNPPEGMASAWIDGHPVLVDIPVPDYKEINISKRGDLISEALSSVVVINTKLNMGRALTSAESDKMNKVLDYIDDLNSLDLSISPTVEWPAKPTI